MALTWALSSVPQPVDLKPWSEVVHFLLSKGFHVATWAVLAMLLVGAFAPGRPEFRHFVAAWLVAFAWGAVDELHQLRSGRGAAGTDILLNGAGAVLGLALLGWVVLVRRGRTTAGGGAGETTPGG